MAPRDGCYCKKGTRQKEDTDSSKVGVLLLVCTLLNSRQWISFAGIIDIMSWKLEEEEVIWRERERR
jgi:hypothetical protein